MLLIPLGDSLVSPTSLFMILLHLIKAYPASSFLWFIFLCCVLVIDIVSVFFVLTPHLVIYTFWGTDLQEVADNSCVYRNEVHHSVSERTQILTDVASDPTLPRTKAVRCAKCQHREAVFFQV